MNIHWYIVCGWFCGMTAELNSCDGDSMTSRAENIYYLIEGGTIWETSIETCTLPHVKLMTSASFMQEAGHPKPVLWDNPEG